MLKLGYQDAGVYQNLEQYAGYIKQLSQSILGVNGYQGVRTTAMANTMTVYDGTQSIGEGQVAFVDLIGQPTWVDRIKVHVKTIMRSDIQVGDVLVLPPTLMQVGPGAIVVGSTVQRTNLSFTGAFRVQRVLHVGSFRGPSGHDWSTNYECLFSGEDASFAFVDQAAEAARAAAVQAQMGGQQPIQIPGQSPLPTPQPQSRLMARSIQRYS